ncbi:MAG: hypothetical protein KDE48_00150 [Anaerolineales bacterium]|nr:hypothetical protein [Anaerolineales bacterium]
MTNNSFIKTKRRFLLIGLIFIFSLFAAAEMMAATAVTPTTSAGTLDPTFNGDGTVTTDFGNNEIGFAVAIQDDGKIIVSGESGFSSFALARYTNSGNLDSSFSSDGKISGSNLNHAYAVGIQADDKIVIAGDKNLDFAVGRYDTGGMPDSTFGSGGFVTTDMGSFDHAYGLVIQDDAKIVLVGENGNFAIARYTITGTLDTSFSGDGKISTNFNGVDIARTVALQTDGKIVVVGRDGSTNFALARYTITGTLDTEFDADGKVTTDLGGSDIAYAAAIQDDGKIVVAGTNGSDFALARYTNSGTLDNSFDGDGKVTTDFGGTDVARAVAIQSNGKIVVAGLTGGQTLNVARYNSNGSLDTTFGSGGLVSTQIDGNNTEGYGMSLQADGKIVVAGQSNNDFAAARYLSSCTTVPPTISNEVELNMAIDCYNAQTAAGIYSTTLTADIALITATTPISNPAAGVVLLINGDGYMVDGQGISGVRPFSIAADTDVTIQNMIIRGGNVSGSGGAIRNNNGNLTLQDSTVVSNTASIEGGGIWANGGSTTILSSTIAHNNGDGGGGIHAGGTTFISHTMVLSNTTDGSGGGIDGGGSITIVESTIRSNEGHDGGGIYTSGGSITLNNSTVDNNEANNVGGGVSSGGNLTLNNAIISNNTAPGNAGGIYIDGNALVITTSQIISNSSGIHGGGLYLDNNTAIVTDTLIAHNHALGQSGGGIYNLVPLTINSSNLYSNTAFFYGAGIANFAALTVTQSTFDANETTAADGGGLYSEGNVVVNVSQSTFSHNSIGESGGGISVRDGVNLTVHNSTFSGNENRQGEPGGGLFNEGSFVTINNSTFSGNSDGIATGVALCFTADMQVLLADGSTKRMADVAVGDELLSYDFGQQQQVTSRVERIIQRQVSEFLRLNDLEVTAEHPFAVGQNEWRTAAELQIGDRVLSDADWTAITSKSVVEKEVEVFNLSVNGPHNYYVFDGRHTYLAHNKNVPDGAGDTTLNNTIITNSSGNDCFSDGGGQFLGSNNLIDEHDAGACSGISSAAVTNFDAELADNGGATQTHALLPGSNALEAGSGCLVTDQRGVARPQNTTCEIGAYELWQLGITAAPPADLSLSWQNANTVCTYDVFEATTPYFTPTPPPDYFNVTSAEVIEERLGNVNTNYFFINRATCSGATAAYSNEVGEFDFAIVPGS